MKEGEKKQGFACGLKLEIADSCGRSASPLAAACAGKIKSEVLPALRARAAAALGEGSWTIEIDADDSQTVFIAKTTMPLYDKNAVR